jgi:phage tail-like protein
MATYGIDYYGDSYYGSNTLVQFNAGNFKATPVNYGKIQLTWDTPSGSWDFIRLLRNGYGFSVNADDGDLLFEQANPGTIFYNDEGQTPNNVGLKEGHTYYYTLFVRNTLHSTWQVAGTAMGISVKNYKTTDTMFNYLPEILHSNIPADTSLDSSNDFLYRFLKLFAFNLDLYKTQAENVKNRYDVTNLDGILIPTFMQEFNLNYEPNIGLKQSRIFLRNIARLYQNKGTLSGLNEFIKAYAGYDNTISQGKNIMLDQNDSSFEQSIGNWASVSNGVLARHSTTDSPTIAPYHELSSQPDFPNLQKATLQVTASTTGNVVIALSGTNPIYYGIPVSPLTNYTFTAYAQAGTTARAVSAQIYWYDRCGNALTPSTSGSATNDAVGSWTRITSSVTSPSNAAFAVPNLKVASPVSGESHYFDALQFEAASSATFFQDARQIEITLVANRINNVINPNFVSPESNGWSVTNGTIAVTTSPQDIFGVDGSITLSAQAGEIYASGAGTVTLTSSLMPVFYGNDYTFSIYCAATDSGDAPTPVTAYINWYDANSALISTSTGTSLTATATYVRPYVTALAPGNAVTAKVGITWTATAAGSPTNGNQVVVDNALFERSSFLNSYFDGGTGVTELSDLFWEGTANNSRSHYYVNRFAIQSRLVSQIPKWVNYGSTFELFLAQPNT